jgi:hypothetical protein
MWRASLFTIAPLFHDLPENWCIYQNAAAYSLNCASKAIGFRMENYVTETAGWRPVKVVVPFWNWDVTVLFITHIESSLLTGYISGIYCRSL